MTTLTVGQIAHQLGKEYQLSGGSSPNSLHSPLYRSNSNPKADPKVLRPDRKDSLDSSSSVRKNNLLFKSSLANFQQKVKVKSPPPRPVRPAGESPLDGILANGKSLENTDSIRKNPGARVAFKETPDSVSPDATSPKTVTIISPNSSAHNDESSEYDDNFDITESYVTTSPVASTAAYSQNLSPNAAKRWSIASPTIVSPGFAPYPRELSVSPPPGERINNLERRRHSADAEKTSLGSLSPTTDSETIEEAKAKLSAYQKPDVGVLKTIPKMKIPATSVTVSKENDTKKSIDEEKRSTSGVLKTVPEEGLKPRQAYERLDSKTLHPIISNAVSDSREFTLLSTEEAEKCKINMANIKEHIGWLLSCRNSGKNSEKIMNEVWQSSAMFVEAQRKWFEHTAGALNVGMRKLDETSRRMLDKSREVQQKYAEQQTELEFLKKRVKELESMNELRRGLALAIVAEDGTLIQGAIQDARKFLDSRDENERANTFEPLVQDLVTELMRCLTDLGEMRRVEKLAMERIQAMESIIEKIAPSHVALQEKKLRTPALTSAEESSLLEGLDELHGRLEYIPEYIVKSSSTSSVPAQTTNQSQKVQKERPVEGNKRTGGKTGRKEKPPRLFLNKNNHYPNGQPSSSDQEQKQTGVSKQVQQVENASSQKKVYEATIHALNAECNGLTSKNEQLRGAVSDLLKMMENNSEQG
ncbi:uncharacterized protein VTP21DRAFT_3934 [Calcarisporiella thermophila]|uniref:uncharacterized protein n=1 Tax=Calcarisporiella thermophila TaxID=911321 RepID=UPI003743D254